MPKIATTCEVHCYVNEVPLFKNHLSTNACTTHSWFYGAWKILYFTLTNDSVLLVISGITSVYFEVRDSDDDLKPAYVIGP